MARHVGSHAGILRARRRHHRLRRSPRIPFAGCRPTVAPCLLERHPRLCRRDWPPPRADRLPRSGFLGPCCLRCVLRAGGAVAAHGPPTASRFASGGVPQAVARPGGSGTAAEAGGGRGNRSRCDQGCAAAGGAVGADRATAHFGAMCSGLPLALRVRRRPGLRRCPRRLSLRRRDGGAAAPPERRGLPSPGAAALRPLRTPPCRISPPALSGRCGAPRASGQAKGGPSLGSDACSQGHRSPGWRSGGRAARPRHMLRVGTSIGVREPSL